MLKRVRSHHDFMWGYLRDLLLCFTRPAIIFLSVLTMTVVGLTSSLFYYLEEASNPNVNSYLDAVYFMCTTITTVGYGDIAPVTGAGRGIAIGMMFLGTGLFVSFTAVIATSIMEIEQRRQERE